jgi:hypothetical protein
MAWSGSRLLGGRVGGWGLRVERRWEARRRDGGSVRGGVHSHKGRRGRSHVHRVRGVVIIGGKGGGHGGLERRWQMKV